MLSCKFRPAVGVPGNLFLFITSVLFNFILLTQKAQSNAAVQLCKG
jgi:hypothetical protein